MPRVATFTVFKTESCPYCQQAMQFLEALKAQRDDVSIRLIDANAEPATFRRVAQQVGRSTVPQIFIDQQYVGGWDDLARSAGNGTLDRYFETGTWHVERKRRWFQKAAKR